MAGPLKAVNPNTGLHYYEVLSTDTKPTVSVPAGSVCRETDTGSEYVYTGSAWVINKLSDGTSIVQLIATATAAGELTTLSDGVTPAVASTSEILSWAYGNWPATWYSNGSSASVATTDNAVVYTSGDVSMYNTHTIECTSATDPVDVYVSLDGTNFTAAPVGVFLIANVTDSLLDIQIATGTVGVLRGKYKAIKVLKNGATAEVGSIRYSHSVN